MKDSSDKEYRAHSVMFEVIGIVALLYYITSLLIGG